jgi:hypothetical protein
VPRPQPVEQVRTGCVPAGVTRRSRGARLTWGRRRRWRRGTAGWRRGATVIVLPVLSEPAHPALEPVEQPDLPAARVAAPGLDRTAGRPAPGPGDHRGNRGGGRRWGDVGPGHARRGHQQQSSIHESCPPFGAGMRLDAVGPARWSAPAPSPPGRSGSGRGRGCLDRIDGSRRFPDGTA